MKKFFDMSDHVEKVNIEKNDNSYSKLKFNSDNCIYIDI